MRLTQHDSASTIGDSTPQQVVGTTWPARLWQSVVEQYCERESILKYHKLVVKLRKAGVLAGVPR